MTFDIADYQPRAISDIVFGDPHAEASITDIVSGALSLPPMQGGKNGILLWGLWGTGKTTLARLLPAAIESAKTGQSGEYVHYDFIQCLMGEANGPQLMRRIDGQSNFVSMNPSGFHYFVLDEVDNLTDAAQASLKAMMNKPSTVFVLTTNHVEKIEHGVRNRCVQIAMNAAAPEKWLPFARRVLAGAGIVGVSDASLIKVIAPCRGSVRDILEQLQMIVGGHSRAISSVTPAAASP